MLLWFQSWLTNLRQFTSFCNVRSQPLCIETGVPQGTPLSCPLFNLYVNDVVECIEYCHINLFADDALLWIDADTVEQALTQISRDFQNVTRYLDMNKMKLSLDKTKMMIIGEEIEQNYININGESLEVVRKIKYLEYPEFQTECRTSFEEDVKDGRLPEQE